MRWVKPVEYHYVLAYIVPQQPPFLGFHQRQRSGVRWVGRGVTRREAFAAIVDEAAKADGLDLGQFSVTFFSLEPNKLAR